MRAQPSPEQFSAPGHTWAETAAMRRARMEVANFMVSGFGFFFGGGGEDLVDCKEV